MYDKGHGVERDCGEAFKWFRLAAEQGSPMAQSNLGLMYDNGLGVPQDYSEAIRWYGLAAEQGVPEAQTNLGLMYDKPHGVPQDYVQAHMWYNLAGASGDAQGLKLRDLIAQKMTPVQIAEAQRRARERLSKTGRTVSVPRLR